jgi:hypothetical protein
MQTTHRPPRTAPWSRPLADLVGAAIDPALARQGFSQSDIILYWEDIVGARLAAMSEPVKLRWPPRGTNKAGAAAEPATLVIRVEGGFALEMQHLTDIVIARVNAHLGWHCVGRIALKQGPLTRRTVETRRRPAPSAAACAAAEAEVAAIGDVALRQALARLGAQVLSRQVLNRQVLQRAVTEQPSREGTALQKPV